MAEDVIYSLCPCERCGEGVEVWLPLSGPWKGRLELTCPSCGHSFPVDYEITNVLEREINKIIVSKSYLEDT